LWRSTISTSKPVHISELGRIDFQFDATRHQLVGDRTRKQFRSPTGESEIARVDLETSLIDFVLAGDSRKARATQDTAPALSKIDPED